MNRDLTILLERRASRRGRNKDPLSSFWEKIYRSVLLVDFAEKSKSRRIKSESRRQFIIALVTSFEVYISDLTAELIEKKKLDIEKLNSLPRRDLSIREVSYIIKNKVTVSELICSAINFQNLDFLSKFLTDIFKVDFINYLRTHKFAYINKAGERVIINLNDNFAGHLKRIFDDRHKFVHDISFTHTPTYKYLDSCRTLMMNFAFCIEILANKYRNTVSCEILER